VGSVVLAERPVGPSLRHQDETATGDPEAPGEIFFQPTQADRCVIAPWSEIVGVDQDLEHQAPGGGFPAPCRQAEQGQSPLRYA
jgi:hypothetical protein